MSRTLVGLLCCSRGATAIEYAILAAGVGLAIVASVGLLGDELAALFNDLVEVRRCIEVGSNCKR